MCGGKSLQWTCSGDRSGRVGAPWTCPWVSSQGPSGNPWTPSLFCECFSGKATKCLCGHRLWSETREKKTELAALLQFHSNVARGLMTFN